MPSIHEILRSAPTAQVHLVNIDSCKIWWDSLKQYDPKLSSSGQLVVRPHIIAAILCEYREVRESLLTYDQCSYLLNAIGAAKLRIESQPSGGATAGAIYNHLQNTQSPF